MASVKREHPGSESQALRRALSWRDAGIMAVPRPLRGQFRRGRLTAWQQSGRSVKVKMPIDSTVATNGSGVCQNFVSMNVPSSTYDWSSYTTIYDSFRVHGVKIKYIPFYNGVAATQTPVSVPMVLFYDVDSTGVGLQSGVTTYAQALSYGNAKVRSTGEPFSVYFKAEKITGATNEPQGWLNATAGTTTTGAVGCFTFVSNGLPSTIFGYFIITYYVEFGFAG